MKRMPVNIYKMVEMYVSARPHRTFTTQQVANELGLQGVEPLVAKALQLITNSRQRR